MKNNQGRSPDVGPWHPHFDLSVATTFEASDGPYITIWTLLECWFGGKESAKELCMSQLLVEPLDLPI